MPLPRASEIDAFAAAQRERRNPAQLIAIRDAAAHSGTDTPTM
jgi:hypothetical protein